MTRRRVVRYCHSCGARLAQGNPLSQCALCRKRTGDLWAGPPDVPADFWTTAPMAGAFGSWHVGQIIRAYRHHPFHGQRPLSQETVARWLNLTQTQLSRVESGPPIKDLDKLISWSRTLKLPADLLWFRLPSERDRRLPAPSGVGDSAPVTFPVLPWMNLARAASANDGSDLAAMQAFRTADRQVGGGHLYATVLSYLQTAVAPRLFGVVDVGQQDSVFTAASALTEMAGWMAHDAGRDAAARQHFQRSLELASTGGDRQLTAHVLGSMSHLALHQGQAGEAVDLARRGEAILTHASANPGLAARLLSMEARGLAILSRPGSATCGKVLLRAEQALDGDQPEPASPWISRFDEGSLASEAARCLRQLGQFEAAGRQARRIIEVRPSSHARSRAFGQLLLANVLLARGELEEACAAGQQALDATASLSSYLVLQQLRALANLLQPYQASRVVATYLTALQLALREPLWISSWPPIDGGDNGVPPEPSR